MTRRLGCYLALGLVLASSWSCQTTDGGAEPNDAGNPGSDVWTSEDGTVGGDPDAAVDPPSRWLTLPDVVNARDVGGYAVAGGQHIRWRVILRGGQLSSLTAGGCGEFTDLTVAGVVDLRTEDERLAAPPPACVSDACEVHATPMPKILPPSEANYLALMAQAEASVVQMFADLASPDVAPVYVHCVIGRDRASFAVALILLALGADHATVLTEFALSNDAAITVDPAHLAAVLDEVEAQGGIDAYLTGLGVDPADLAGLRSWALE